MHNVLAGVVNSGFHEFCLLPVVWSSLRRCPGKHLNISVRILVLDSLTQSSGVKIEQLGSNALWMVLTSVTIGTEFCVKNITEFCASIQCVCLPVSVPPSVYAGLEHWYDLIPNLVSFHNQMIVSHTLLSSKVNQWHWCNDFVVPAGIQSLGEVAGGT